LMEELKDIEEQVKVAKETDKTEALTLKALSLLIKLMQNIRTNMVAIMRHYQVPMVDARREGGTKDSEE